MWDTDEAVDWSYYKMLPSVILDSVAFSNEARERVKSEENEADKWLSFAIQFQWITHFSRFTLPFSGYMTSIKQPYRHFLISKSKGEREW